MRTYHVKKEQGQIPVLSLLAAFAVELLDDLAEWSSFQVEVTLDGEASGPADFFHFGEDKVAPLLFVATWCGKIEYLPIG
jgi:hypothetical protein